MQFVVSLALLILATLGGGLTYMSLNGGAHATPIQNTSTNSSTFCINNVTTLSLDVDIPISEPATLERFSPTPKFLDFETITPTAYADFLDNINVPNASAHIITNIAHIDQVRRAKFTLKGKNAVSGYAIQPQSSYLCGANNCPVHILVSTEENRYKPVFFDGNATLYTSGYIALASAEGKRLTLFAQPSISVLSIWSGDHCQSTEESSDG